MSKSNIRKTREKTVVTNKVINWSSTAILNVGGNVEIVDPFYIIPRKGEAFLDRLIWTIFLNEDPALDVNLTYAILDHGRDTDPALTTVQLVNASIVNRFQAWHIVTAVGIVQTAETIEVELDQTISRRSNLQADNDYAITPAYAGSIAVDVGQRGTFFVKETLFQLILRDAPDEWIGYTFEESAQ